ncbi:hypothetical protein GYMLUDRAFT_581638 [Collybiopsis luxurians FD-317 M1]|uniref:Uncharacterized protein n=1 Tax=Collybiopsis luxurians FD-317 M1 TaxID=944289 RepID=A0A0D0CFK1_9AGAR|nr:hypothetical protein GYMLUDRAFT_581638 [Collybiopsis luxurians FD-317 M1]
MNGFCQIDPSEAMLDLTFLQDRIRAASGAKNEAEDEYPVTFYRYDLEVTKKQLSPNASQFNCFSAKASKSYYESLIPSRPDSASKSPSKSNRKPATNTSIPRTNHNSCFSESLYFPPDSDRAQKIGREVARLVREAGDYLESQVSLISETLAGRGEGVPASPVNPSTPGPSSNTRSSSQSASKPSVRITRNTTPSMSSNAQITPRTRSRAIRVESPVASASALLRPSSTSPIKRTRNGLAKSSTNNMESLIVTASQQLFEKLKLAVYQEDTLSMHICPRAECTAPRGRAWHRSCLIREEPNIPSDAEADEEDFDGFKALQNLGSWLSQGYRRNRANETEPPPTYQQIRARWDRMSESQKMQVARMLELLSTIPPGYSRDPDRCQGAASVHVSKKERETEGADKRAGRVGGAARLDDRRHTSRSTEEGQREVEESVSFTSKEGR